MNKIVIWALRIMKKTAMAMIRQSSYTNSIFHILGEVGAELEVSCKAHLP